MNREPIKGYEGIYEVCQSGTVVRVDSRKALKPAVAKNGYLVVSLWKNNKGKSHHLHRILAEAFLPKLKNETRLTVNHIDGDKLNNNLQNLEWCTYSENNKHAYDKGLKIVSAKTRAKTSERMRELHQGNNYRGLKVSQFNLNGELIQTFPSVEKAAETLNIHRKTIERNAKGLIKNPKWWIFKYEEEKHYGN